jgi:hypothetical protein
MGVCGDIRLTDFQVDDVFPGSLKLLGALKHVVSPLGL